MCKDRDAFAEYEEEKNADSVSSAKSDVKLKVIGHGTVKLRVWNVHAWIDARLGNTLHVQDFSINLFSLTAAASRGMTVEITHNECVVKRGWRPVASGRKQDFLIYLNVEGGMECHVAEHETELWHRSLGHALYGTINAMIKHGRIKCVEIKRTLCATYALRRSKYAAIQDKSRRGETLRECTV